MRCQSMKISCESSQTQKNMRDFHIEKVTHKVTSRSVKYVADGLDLHTATHRARKTQNASSKQNQ